MSCGGRYTTDIARPRMLQLIAARGTWPRGVFEYPSRNVISKGVTMQAQLRNFLSLVFLMMMTFVCAQAFADSTADAVKAFRGAGQTKPFFDNSYGYAVFPTIG